MFWPAFRASQNTRNEYRQGIRLKPLSVKRKFGNYKAIKQNGMSLHLNAFKFFFFNSCFERTGFPAFFSRAGRKLHLKRILIGLSVY